MTEGKKFTPGDEALSAWIDGGLDNNGATEMEKLAAMDEGLATRAARLRHLDDVMRQAVPLDEEIPQDLLARLGLADTGATSGGAEVIDLFSARKARQDAAPLAAPARRLPMLAGGWRIAAQLVLIMGVGLAGAVWLHSGGQQPDRQPAAPYVALGDAPEPGQAASDPANAIVMFSAGVDAGGARAIVSGAGAKIVSGPSETGVWQVSIAPDERDAVLLRLRHRGDVSLAEPIDGVEP